MDLHSVANASIDLGFGPIECDVLSDGRRVLRSRHVDGLFGVAAKKGDLQRSVVRIASKHADLASPPTFDAIEYKAPGAPRVHGYEPRGIVDVCRMLVRARSLGVLLESQIPIADAAMNLLAALAGIAIEAMIDEATGIQATRAPDYLQRRFDLLLRQADDPDRWRRMWSEDFTARMCFLYGKPHTGPNPRWMAEVNGWVYRMVLGDEAYAELKRRNPLPTHYSNHHQFLTDPARALMAKDLDIILALANTSTSRREFRHRTEVQYRGKALQLEMGR